LQFSDKAALNQFLKGTMEGAWESLKSNWNTITHPIETVKGVIEAVKTLASLSKEDLSNLASQLTESGKDLIFKDDVSEVANKAGKVVGALAVEIALGKGVGLALKAVKGIPAITSLVTKAEDLAKIAKLKVIAEFSDEAASLASQRARKALATQLYSGIPIDAMANLAVVAGNKIGKGVVKFTEFSKQMVAEFGDKIKPHLEKLYRNGLIELDLSEGKQILSNSGKVIDNVVIREVKEKAIELAMRGQPQDVKKLKELLHSIGEKYGSEFKDEVKKTVENTIDNVFEGRRNPVINDMLGGHTIYDLFDGKIDTKHVGKTVEQLKARLKRETNLRAASSFTNLERANKAQREFIKHYEKEIADWLINGKGTFEKKLEIGEDLGNIVGRGKTGANMGTKVFVVLAKDGTNKGFHVVTSFPTL
jgi:Bacterial CdiA-CT RNAse A domain